MDFYSYLSLITMRGCCGSMDFHRILELEDVLRDHLLHFCCLVIEETESRSKEMTFSRLKSRPELSMLMLLWATRALKGTVGSLSFRSHMIVDGFLVDARLTRNAFTDFQEMFWWEWLGL